MTRVLTYAAMAALALWLPPMVDASAPATTRQRELLLRYEPADRQLALAVGRTAAAALTQVSGALETIVTGPIVLNVYSDRQAYQQATGAPAKNLELGRASAPPDVIDIDASGMLGDMHRITRHEITHIVLNHALGPGLDRCPRWVQEGIARYFEEPSVPLDPAVQDLLSRRPSVHTDHLDYDIQGGGERGRLAYAQSEALIRWLVDRRGPEVLPRLVHALRGGRDFDTALEAAAGMTVGQLERGWHRSAAWSYLIYSNTTIWLLMTVLLLVSVVLVHLRRRQRQRLQSLAEEGFDERLDQPDEDAPIIH